MRPVRSCRYCAGAVDMADPHALHGFPGGGSAHGRCHDRARAEAERAIEAALGGRTIGGVTIEAVRLWPPPGQAPAVARSP